jgi:hypothetical protein
MYTGLRYASISLPIMPAPHCHLSGLTPVYLRGVTLGRFKVCLG